MFSVFIFHKGNKNLYNYIFTSRNRGGDQSILTGEEGWQIWSGQIIYFQLELGQKIYFQKKKTRGKGGGVQNVGKKGNKTGVSMWLFVIGDNQYVHASVCKCMLVKYLIKNKCLLDFHSIINMYTNTYKYIGWYNLKQLWLKIFNDFHTKWCHIRPFKCVYLLGYKSCRSMQEGNTDPDLEGGGGGLFKICITGNKLIRIKALSGGVLYVYFKNLRSPIIILLNISYQQKNISPIQIHLCPITR